MVFQTAPIAIVCFMNRVMSLRKWRGNPGLTLLTRLLNRRMLLGKIPLSDIMNLVERRKLTIIIQGFHLTLFFLVQLYWLVESSLIMFVRR